MIRSEMQTNVPRVLHLLACDAIGGTERMVCSQVEHAERVTYEVATLAAPGPVAERLLRLGTPVQSLGPGSWWTRLRRLRNLLRSRRYDIVNAYGFKASILARCLLRTSVGSVAPQPILVCGVRDLHTTEVEDMNSPKARAVALVERATRGFVDIWDANSPGAVAFVESLGVAPERIRYIPNGLDLTEWPLTQQPRADPAQIVCVSRFVPRKRQVDLVRALAAMRDAGVEFGAQFIGDGPTLDDVRGLASSLGLAQQVQFHGALNHASLRQIMATASLFCLVSTHEGMPWAVMEAMAMALPVIGTDVNGINALVVDGVTGRLVAPGDPIQLASVLAQCLANVNQLRAMGLLGRQRIEQHFSLDKMIARKETLYWEALELIH